MLVLVNEEIEESQRLIPSVIGLNGLDDVKRRCGNVIPPQLRSPIRVVNAVVADWEIDNVLPGNQRLAVKVLRESPRDVIETGPHIAKTIAQDATQSARGFGFENGMGRRHISAYINRDFIRLTVKVLPNFILERVEVFLSPDDFEPGSV
jgi:hypothetical protein